MSWREIREESAGFQRALGLGEVVEWGVKELVAWGGAPEGYVKPVRSRDEADDIADTRTRHRPGRPVSVVARKVITTSWVEVPAEMGEIA